MSSQVLSWYERLTPSIFAITSEYQFEFWKILDARRENECKRFKLNDAKVTVEFQSPDNWVVCFTMFGFNNPDIFWFVAPLSGPTYFEVAVATHRAVSELRVGTKFRSIVRFDGWQVDEWICPNRANIMGNTLRVVGERTNKQINRGLENSPVRDVLGAVVWRRRRRPRCKRGQQRTQLLRRTAKGKFTEKASLVAYRR